MSVTRFQPEGIPAGGLAAELDAEKRVVNRFIALLKTEQRALKEGFVDALEQLAQEKSALVSELNRLKPSATAPPPPPAPMAAACESWIAREAGMAGTPCGWNCSTSRAKRAASTRSTAS